MRTRMVRFDRLAGRLSRLVRQTAQTLNKKARLDLVGGESEVDRSVQERMIAPLEHMLRNAISHGLEMPVERASSGKPETGRVELALTREGGEIVITVQDDGRGIDLEAVRAKAVKEGRLESDRQIPDRDLLNFVLQSGFSTARQITQISGRGVGLDVVSAEIKELGGTLDIQSEAGVGTQFVLRLPLTLAINQALLVDCLSEVYALPLASIAGITETTAGELQPYYLDAKLRYQYAGTEYEILHLGTLLNTGAPRFSDPDLHCTLVMVRAGERRVALHVERLVGRCEIVVKPVGPQLSTLKGISGATIMADGRVVLILEPGGLLRMDSAAEPFEQPANSANDERQAPSIMVVDDSITIRKVTARMLERHKYNVVTAKDGMDAVAALAERKPDLMLLDIEMPRMDGYELAAYIRNSVELKDLPIIMITSRTGDKHRKRAEDLGVNKYLGKPYQEVELIENIAHLLGKR
jgi:chemosensory pili system protein ChpA (sensor histidine kinase/response regulator)